jgi:glutamate carboxypeptidase
MHQYAPYINWLEQQHETMVDLVCRWAEVNSGSRNLTGLERMLALVAEASKALGGSRELIELPPTEVVSAEGVLVLQPLGRVLRIRKRPHSKVRLFLGIHYDTVYPADHEFQLCRRIDTTRLQGPGVADAKGGLVVMLKALEAFERSPWAENLGWEVLVNPDEEVGSSGSAGLLAEAAQNNHVGLVFEPSFPDGTLVCSRKGTGNFSMEFQGRAAHAGRNPQDGRNAVNALADFIVHLNAAFAGDAGILVNVANVKGGGPLNVVPDLASCGFNVRVDTAADRERLQANMERLLENVRVLDGISVKMHGHMTRPPKPLDERTEGLLQFLAQCGSELGIDVRWAPSGGASDGNLLAAAGLPTVDSLGVKGGNLHSAEEFCLMDSLVERAKLTALFLMKLGAGEIALPTAESLAGPSVVVPELSD